jgi:hypothetical protein
VLSEWHLIGKDLVGSDRDLILMYNPLTGLKGLRKTTKNLSQDSQSPGPRNEPGTSGIRIRYLSRPRRSVQIEVILESYNVNNVYLELEGCLQELSLAQKISLKKLANRSVFIYALCELL